MIMSNFTIERDQGRKTLTGRDTKWVSRDRFIERLAQITQTSDFTQDVLILGELIGTCKTQLKIPTKYDAHTGKPVSYRFKDDHNDVWSGSFFELFSLPEESDKSHYKVVMGVAAILPKKIASRMELAYPIVAVNGNTALVIIDRYHGRPVPEPPLYIMYKVQHFPLE